MVEAREELKEAKLETKQFTDDVKLWKRAQHLENTYVREFLLHEQRLPTREEQLAAKQRLNNWIRTNPFIEYQIMQNLYALYIPDTPNYHQQCLNFSIREKADRFFYALATIDPPVHELRIASCDMLIESTVGSFDVFERHR